MQTARTNPVFKSSAEVLNLASEPVFGSNWHRQTFKLLEKAGFEKVDPANPFYSKAVWQQMEELPVIRRMTVAARKMMGTNLAKTEPEEALRIMRREGLVLRPGAEEPFKKSFQETRSQAFSFGNAEGLAAHLTAQICHAVIPGLVIKPGSPKEAVLWAMIHPEIMPWPHVSTHLGADTPAKQRSLERASKQLVAELVPEAIDGDLSLVAKLRKVCGKLDLCQNDTPPALLRAGGAR